ncbi:hypothetical protein ElyMa_004437100 [Elysia marginata]|uniref:Uncharacterized protein n=1 Tax=Elysia marginata TaxID=1093978 RepID=A0AAV4HDK4_9GAST|nr:hypothetical protein ElyMa_004437100 [Elysia marginata]
MVVLLLLQCYGQQTGLLPAFSDLIDVVVMSCQSSGITSRPRPDKTRYDCHFTGAKRPRWLTAKNVNMAFHLDKLLLFHESLSLALPDASHDSALVDTSTEM